MTHDLEIQWHQIIDFSLHNGWPTLKPIGKGKYFVDGKRITRQTAEKLVKDAIAKKKTWQMERIPCNHDFSIRERKWQV